MKISEQDYAELKLKIELLFKENESSLEATYTKYKEAGYSDMRFNFDVYYTVTSPMRGDSKFDYKKLYDAGLNDSHINAALAKILGNSGRNSNGKR